MNIRIAAVSTYLWSGAAFGQALNIDCTVRATSPTPSSGYGAAAGQQGFWSAVPNAVDFPLRDVVGSVTTATFSCIGGVGEGLTVPSSNPDEVNLLTDAVTMDFLGNFITIAGLQTGWYDLYVYCWVGRPDSLPFEGRISTGFNTVGLSASSNLPWPGGQVEGITYAKATIRVGTYLSIDTSPPLNRSYVVSGIQLVPVPAPGGLAFLAGGGLLACARRRR